MQTGRSQNEVVQILAASVSPESGPGGVGVMAPNLPPTAVSRVYEQAVGTPEELQYRAIIRALELGRRLRAQKIRVSAAEESVVRQINREIPVPQGGRLPLLYIKARALMYGFEHAEVEAVSRAAVEPAYRLALAASRIPVRKPPRNLFNLSEISATNRS